jgi:hypothetical protein
MTQTDMFPGQPQGLSDSEAARILRTTLERIAAHGVEYGSGYCAAEAQRTLADLKRMAGR